LSYDVYGEGPALLLVPGLGCDARMWGPVLDKMELKVTAIVVHAWEAGSMTEAADMAERALNAVGAERAFLAGLSMGGYVVLEFLRRHGEKAIAAALIDTTAFPDDEDRRAKRDQTVELIDKGKFEEVLGPFVHAVLWQEGELRDAAAELILKMARGLGPEAYKRSMISIRDRGNYLDVLESCRAPLLFLAGTHDWLSPPALAHDMAARAQRAEMFEIPGTGHMSALERPALVAARLDEFFRSCLRVA